MPVTDPERRKEVRRRYYERNAEEIKRKQRAYIHEMDPERRREKRREWKAQHRRNNKAKGLTAMGTEPKRPSPIDTVTFAKKQDVQARRNAGEAWDYWIAELAPTSVVAAYRAIDQHRDAERYRYRYQNDEGFRQIEKARCLSRKQRDRQLKREQLGDMTLDREKAMREEAIGAGCFYCSVILDEANVTLDHAIPLSARGPHDSSNIVPACRSCNSSKQDGDWPKRLEEQRG